MKNRVPDNYYDLLEVSPRARIEVIKAAYKVLIKEYHPDSDNGNSRITKALNEAKHILTDEKKRAHYDRERNSLEGTVIGNYRVLELIAEGGFGKTYRGEHVRLGMPVCIKHGLHISPQDEEILQEEARAIWDLRHFGIPAIRDLLKLEDGSVALVMSFIPGPTLHQIIEKNDQLDPEHVCWIMERVFNILKYLHYHGVIHGDVKPQNIIVPSETHSVVLVDYGLALIRPGRDSASAGYTPYFSPPEQLEGSVLLPQSDFYGMAMTMVQALGGNIARKEVPDSVPEALCEYLRRFLKRDILSRPSWEGEDFTDTIRDLRVEIFGRRRSAMKPIKGFE